MGMEFMFCSSMCAELQNRPNENQKKQQKHGIKEGNGVRNRSEIPPPPSSPFFSLFFLQITKVRQQLPRIWEATGKNFYGS
jgi:hypothetical protein